MCGSCAQTQTSVFGLNASVLGQCELFEERGLGDERFNFFLGCPKAKAATIIL
jgi:T-complex protein 1 subunit eta